MARVIGGLLMASKQPIPHVLVFSITLAGMAVVGTITADFLAQRMGGAGLGMILVMMIFGLAVPLVGAVLGVIGLKRYGQRPGVLVGLVACSVVLILMLARAASLGWLTSWFKYPS